MRPNSKLIGTTLIGALGGLLFGFDIAVVSGIIDPVVRLYGLGDYSKGWTVAIGTIGTVLGCFIAGVAGQRLGARAALRLAAALYIFAALGCAFSVGWPMLLCARFLAGMAIGTASVLGPVTSRSFRRPCGADALWALSRSTWWSEFCWVIPQII